MTDKERFTIVNQGFIELHGGSHGGHRFVGSRSSLRYKFPVLKPLPAFGHRWGSIEYARTIWTSADGSPIYKWVR